MTSRTKKVSSKSFVGLGSRSKTGCTECRKRKKKCDEVHPVCGICQKHKTQCKWTNKIKQKYDFDYASMIDSQKQLKMAKSQELKQLNSNRKMKKAAIITQLENPKTFANKILVHKERISQETIYRKVKKDDSDIERAIDDIMDDKNKMNDFIFRVVEHIKSPAFNPTSNILDLSLSSVVKHAQLVLSKKSPGETSLQGMSLNSPFSPSQFIQHEDYNIDDAIQPSSLVSQKITEIERDRIENDQLNKSDYDDSSSKADELDIYAPMDESQLLENIYISDSDLIKVFESKELHPYLRPTVHLLLSRNNALKLISPSSPILRQLDATGRMFLENYVTNLAMSQLDIGNDQFFLHHALSQASEDPAILYCLVAWGGMFLVGRNNQEANKYTNKGFKLIEEKKEKLSLTFSGFDNQENLKLLLFYGLFQCAEISCGDVNNWFQMLLQSKDLLKKYGGLRQFIQANKNSKVAKWIISNVFYHDVLCTRALDYGTVIPISEYKDVFDDPSYLEDNDYGLDPFYGLSQNLYLILGEVANSRRLMKNSVLPLNFEFDNGISNKMAESKHKQTEESWFQIFDWQIMNCKPPPEKVEILTKNSSDWKLWEHHLTWYELTQISLRIYIRINFKEMEFDDSKIQQLREKGMKLFDVLIGTKLQTLLGLALLMLGVTSVTKKSRDEMERMYNRFLSNYEILNVRVCWEIIQLIWSKYDKRVEKGESHYIDWPEVVNAMGWNCCFT